MKNKGVIFWFFLVLLTFGTGLQTMAQENPESKQIKKEIRTIVIKDGEKTVMDTVIYGGDTEVFPFDGTKETRKMIVHEEELDGDSGKQVRVTVREIGPGDEDVMMYDNGRRGQRRMITRPLPPAMPRLQAAPGARTFMFRSQQSPNVIDLADPGVISFKKKKMSGGREKITVIRQEVKEMNWEEKQIMQIDRNLKSGGDADLERMNAPRVVRELDIRRKDLPAPSEVPAPADKK